MQFRGKLFLSGVLFAAGVLAQAQDVAPPPSAAVPTIRTETRLVLVDVVVTDKKGNYVSDLALKDFKVWEDNKEQSLKTFQFGADPSAPGNSQKRYMVLFFDNSSMDMGDQIRARQEAGKFIDKNAGPERLMAIVNFGGSLQISQNFTGDAERLKQVVSNSKMSATSTQAPAVGLPRLGGSEADFGARTVLLALRTLSKNLSEVPGRKTLVMFTSGFPLTSELRPELTAAIDACNRSNVAVYPIDVRGLVAPTQFPFGSPRGALQPLPGAAEPRALASASFDKLAGESACATATGTAHAEVGQAVSPALMACGPFLPVVRSALGIALAGNPVVQIAAAMTYALEQGRGGGGGTTGGGGGAPAGGGGAPAGGGGTGGGAPSGGGGRGGATGVSPSGGNPGGSGVGGRGGFGSPGAGNPGNNGLGGRGGNPGNAGGGAVNPGGRNGGFNNANGVPQINRQRVILPTIPESATTNQEVLYALAQGTGGFVILNTNDLLGGLEKIGKEQSEYYIVGYTPPDSKEGDCHTLRVKVNRGGTNFRARTGYCNSRSMDVLAGKPIERQLETRATGTEAGNIAAAMTLPFFYTAPDTARVNVSIDMPASDIKFEKVKGKFHAELNVLGIAYRPNANVAARFSDTVKLDFEDKKEVEKFAEKPYHYENQFDVASGQYTLKVAFSASGESFGKLEAPLNIDAYDGKMFMLSSLALSAEFHKVDDISANMDQALLEGRAPLVAGPYQFNPAGAARFKPTQNVAIYFELYDPKLQDETPPGLQVQLKVLDRKSGEQKVDSGAVNVGNFIRKGNPVVPIGLKLPVTTLTAGAYRLEMMAMDSAGRSMIRSADFDVQ